MMRMLPLSLFTNRLQEVFSETPGFPLFVILGCSYLPYRELPYAAPIAILIAVNTIVNAEATTSTHPMARSGRFCATRS
jgi:Na+/citrate or Na+/malate symporter